MNIIRKLKIELHAERLEKTALLNGINDLLLYVSSEKFWTDTHVEAADVILRIREARDNAENVRLGYENEVYQKERKEIEALQAKEKRSCEKCGAYGKTWEETYSVAYGPHTILCKKCRVSIEHSL